MLLKTKYSGEELTHRVLWRVVEQNASIASECTEGWFYPILVSEVFAFHTIEAYINFVGESIAPEVWKDERNFFRREPYRGWEGKLRMILEMVGLDYVADKPPMTTIADLRFIRDLIAHGKPETIADEVVHAPGVGPAALSPSTLTQAVAKRGALPDILATVESFLDSIHLRAAPIMGKTCGQTDRAIWFGDKALRGTAYYSSADIALHRAEQE